MVEDKKSIAKVAAKEKRAKARKLKALSRKVDSWRSGADIVLLDWPDTLLRLSSNLETIQTSLGQCVPVGECVAAYDTMRKVLRHVKSSGFSWYYNEAISNPIIIGPFCVKEISEDEVAIGCHVVKWEEIDRCYAEVVAFKPSLIAAPQVALVGDFQPRPDARLRR